MGEVLWHDPDLRKNYRRFTGYSLAQLGLKMVFAVLAMAFTITAESNFRNENYKQAISDVKASIAFSVILLILTLIHFIHALFKLDDTAVRMVRAEDA